MQTQSTQYRSTSRSTSAPRPAPLPSSPQALASAVARARASITSLPPRPQSGSVLRPQSSQLPPAPIRPPVGLPPRVSFPAPGTSASAKRITLHTLQQLKQDLYAQAAWAARHQPPAKAAVILREADTVARKLAFVINTVAVKM